MYSGTEKPNGWIERIQGLGSTCKAARAVLPPQSIALKVGIQKAVPVVLQAPLPGEEKVLDEEACADHSAPIV